MFIAKHEKSGTGERAKRRRRRRSEETEISASGVGHQGRGVGGRSRTFLATDRGGREGEVVAMNPTRLCQRLYGGGIGERSGATHVLAISSGD